MQDTLTWHRILAAAIGAALCVGPAAAAPPKDEKDKDEELLKLAGKDVEFQKRINEAVAAGVEGLLGRGQPDGRWPTEHDTAAHAGGFPHGGTALAIYALLKAKVNRYDPKIEAGLKWLKERWDNFKAGGKPIGGATSWKIYEAGIALMMLEALGMWAPASQAASHGTQAMGKNLQKNDLEWVKELRDFILEHQTLTRQVPFGGGKGGAAGGLEDRKEAWSYPSSARMITDHSNTQYAVLGLKSAARMGYPSPGINWVRILEGFIFTQAVDGEPVKRVMLDPGKEKAGYAKYHTVTSITDFARGWGYAGGGPPTKPGTGQMAETGSMTTVGIACVALAWSEIDAMAAKGDKDARDAQKDLGKAKEKSIRDGLAWLAQN